MSDDVKAPLTGEPLARIAYAAYGASVGWKNYQGLPMPTYDALPEAIKAAWIAAAEAARAA